MGVFHVFTLIDFFNVFKNDLYQVFGRTYKWKDK